MMRRTRRAACAKRLCTRGGRLLDVARDVEVEDVERVDLLHLLVRPRRMIRRGHELLDLLFTVDVRQRGDDALVRIEPHQRELADRHPPPAAKWLEPLDLLQSFHEPRPRTMRPVIALIELRV